MNLKYATPALPSKFVKLAEWFASITFFTGYTGVFPSAEHVHISWKELISLICPKTPHILADKAAGIYYLPCALKEAPYVGKTLNTATNQQQTTVGKMRSNSHVTEASFMTVEFDGIQEDDFQSIIELNIFNTFLVFSSYSNGNPDKPGRRFRMIVPLDKAVDDKTYRVIWKQFNATYCKGLADPSSGKLCQQQGVWSTNEQWKAKVFKCENEGSLVSVDSLLGDNLQVISPVAKNDKVYSLKSDANAIADSCNQIKLFRDEKGADQSEPLWKACLSIVVHCADGEEIAQDWSSGHAGYSRQATEGKIEQRLSVAPATCGHFRSTYAEGCEGCTESCNSPISLGYPVEFKKRTEPAKVVPISSAKQRSDSATSRFPEVIPYSYPVDPSELFDDIRHTLRRFIIMGDEQADIVTLWIVLTWVIDYVGVAPLLLINAPEKACGKTQLLEKISEMCYRPLISSNLSASYLFRSIEKNSPTLLIDETDTFIKSSDEIKGIINAGHTRASAFVGRVVGDNHEPHDFNVFCAKGFAGIQLQKCLPESTLSRGFMINLRRKLPGESVERSRSASKEIFTEISSKLARFSEDYCQQIQSASAISLPDELDDRFQDNLEPLIAIAQCAGTEWTNRTIDAALFLSQEAKTLLEPAINTNLLHDIKEIRQSMTADKISSYDLLEKLAKDSDSPWLTYNRGNPITPRQIGKLLAPYGIKSKNLKFPNPTGYGASTCTLKGYEFSQFDDAFTRYLND